MSRRLVIMLGLMLLAARVEAVVNGQVVTQARFDKEFPWAVALQSTVSTQVCGAVLISPTFLLTAAHCTSKSLVAQLSSADRRKATRLEVADAIVHPRFDGKQAGQFDIGLIRLGKPVKIPTLRVAGEQESIALLRSGPRATILGWGHQQPGGSFADELAAAEVALSRGELRGTLILTEDLHAGVCVGDSGGPLIARDGKGRAVLVGIASVTDGDLCAKGGGIAGYTNVGQLHDFIRDNVPDLPRPL